MTDLILWACVAFVVVASIYVLSELYLLVQLYR